MIFRWRYGTDMQMQEEEELEVQYIQYVGAKVRGAREQGVDVTIGRIG